MTKKANGKRILFSLLPAAAITVMADLALALFAGPMPMTVFLLLFFGLAAGLYLCKRISLGLLRRGFFSLLALFLVAVLGIFAQLGLYAAATGYQRTDEGKEALFGGHSVMVIAPHQDDELSMLAGTLEEYIRYGSTVRLVFPTNGDLEGNGPQRLREALSAAAFLGIPPEQVIFLGYGDGWYLKDGIHLYNAPADWVAQSYALRNETYALPEHPPFREGRAYTRQNLYEDIRDVMAEYKPDVIFTTAYEPHGDHRATALLVEEALGELLAREEGYTPLLLESVSYHSSYFGAEDFYSENARAIPNPFGESYNTDVHIYNWEDRVRLPVDAASLSRSLLGSQGFRALSKHASQGCNLRAESILSGETVFWKRDTASLSYRSEFAVSSGDARFLHNFKLLDSSNINSEAKPFEDLWLPTDEEKTAVVRLASPAQLQEIRLYDNPSLEDNVLAARIVFDDGSSLETGPLPANGSAAVVPVGRRTSSFTVQLLETEGERAGLTELEFYEGAGDYGLSYVKIQNEQGDFVYDYYIQPDGVEYFELYTAGGAPALESGEYSLVCATKGSCSASFADGKILVSCPAGQSCTVSIRSADGGFEDSVVISNPGLWKRSLGQRFESFWMDAFYESLRFSNSYRLPQLVYRLLRYGL